jgi:hypothetical protein
VVWTGLIWLRIVTSGGLLRTRLWTFGFHKNSWKFLSSCASAGFSRKAQLHGVSYLRKYRYKIWLRDTVLIPNTSTSLQHIQSNSVLIYLPAKVTDQRPVTMWARVKKRNKTQRGNNNQNSNNNNNNNNNNNKVCGTKSCNVNRKLKTVKHNYML